MKRIVEGLVEFQSNVYPRHKDLFERLKNNQTPSALFITCSDSRVVPNLILQADPGELFIIRTAGNMIPPYAKAHGGGVAASIEYAVEVLGIRDIVLCAHSDCGAMKAVLDPEKVASMPAVAEWVRHGELARRHFLEEQSGLEGSAALDRIAKLNVVQQLKHLVAYPFIRSRVERDEIELYGWFYRIESGQILTFDSTTGEVVEVAEGAPGDWCERTLLRLAEAEEDLWDKL